jgi:adenylosuccinate synthase
MSKRIVLLSGRICSGKSTLGRMLAGRYGAAMFRSREEIQRLRPGVVPDRSGLQVAGDDLDDETTGGWVVAGVQRREYADDALIVVDSVRIPSQIGAFRNAYGQAVTHVHITAPLETIRRRYAERPRGPNEPDTYDEAAMNPTERDVEGLGDICDVLIDTTRNTEEDVLVRAAARIGMYQRLDGAHVDVIIGAQWGSEGKGHMAAFLAREYDYLVRVGGPNAGHKVIKPEFTYRLLPSGTLHNSGAKLLIGPGATLDVDLLQEEIQLCDVGVDRLFIDPHAMVIEKSDLEYEQGTLASIASTKKGGGYAAARRLMRGGLKGTPAVRLARDVEALKPYVHPIVEKLDAAYRAGARIFVEGTQGSGLSLFHGPYPYVTSRDTTVAGTLAECGIAPARVRRVIMVARTYPIRVANPKDGSGTSGPMSLETSWDEIARRSGLDAEELKAHEHTSVSKQLRRVGEFDWALFRKACSLNGPTDIALTFADYISKINMDARRFEQLSEETLRFIEEVERVAGAPVSLIGTRFHERSIIDRRTWS